MLLSRWHLPIRHADVATKYRIEVVITWH